MKTIELAYQKIVKEPQDLLAVFKKAIKLGFEGVMAKKLEASYQAGARSYNWVKLKHLGKGKLLDTLDCLVMGYYAGRGKRSDFGIGAFLVGVRSSDLFVTLAKIGTGLTDEQWRKLKIQSSKFKAQTKPKEYKVHKNLFPDVWVAPSIVVEIAADEITKSPVHTASLALRFPRLISFRADKSPQQVTTLSEVRRLFKLQY